MNTEVELRNKDDFLRSIQDLRNDAVETNLLIIGHVDSDPKLIDVSHSGTNVAELTELLDDTQVMYVLARLKTTYDATNAVKFVYVHWLGTKVPFAKRGRYGVFHGSVKQYLQPYHLEFQADSTAEVTVEVMLQKLNETAGTFSKVMETSDTEGMQERGFTQTQTSKSAGSVPGRSTTSTKIDAVSTQGAPVTFAADVAGVIAELRSDDHPTNWLLAGYEDGNHKSPITITGSGTNGLGELKELLRIDQVFYGLLRVGHKVDDISTVKFVYIVWVGKEVRPMMKGKITTHKGSCEKIFSPAHVAVFASELSDLIETDIIDKVEATSGRKSNALQ